MNILIILALVQYVLGQGMPKKPAPLPMADDIPYIVCDVCQKAAKTLFKNVKQKRKDEAPVKLSEEDVLNIVEKTCEPENDYGEWITKIDVTEEKDKLKLVEHTKVGRCQEECKTVQRACEDAIGDIDTDIGEILWKNELKLSSFINEACFQLSKKCSSKNTKKYKKGKRKDHKFVEMSEKEKEATKMMNNMKGMPGMPGMEMYSREDIEAMQHQMQGEHPQDVPEGESDDQDESGGHSQNVSFLELLKQIGRDLLKKFKMALKYIVKTVNWLFGNTGKKKKREL